MRSEPIVLEPPAACRAPARPRRHRVALVTDPRFSGGTSAGVAAEIRALSCLADRIELRVVALETAMFRGRTPHPAILAACEAQGIALEWNPPVVHADTLVLQNPSCLRFDRRLPVRLSCDTACVVTRENFLRPNGAAGFDVGACLDLVERSLVSRRRLLAPMAGFNRAGVEAWLARNPRDWEVAPFDWFDVFDQPLLAPNPAPRDRRGRHSRAGFEKFPPMATMLAHFPPHAEHCAILGGDGFLLDPGAMPAHWTVLRFGAADVEAFLRDIDFFVYFTNPLWQESFGRVIAEAIAAGKLVITDPDTAATFGSGVVATDGSDVDAIIAGFVAEPARYVAFVEAAQAALARFRPEAFARLLLTELVADGARHAVR